MRGGYRPGAGRPRKSPVKPESPAAVPPKGGYDGIGWLTRVVNDPTADPARRDRAAAVLAGIEGRRGQPPGKKVLAEQASKLAGWKTSWWGLLHDTDAPDFDPDGLPDHERKVWDETHRQAAPKPGEPARRAFDQILSEREDRLERERRQSEAKWNSYLHDEEEQPPNGALAGETLDTKRDVFQEWIDPKTGKSDLEFNPRGYRYPPDDE
jgi:hypothetical protein